MLHFAWISKVHETYLSFKKYVETIIKSFISFDRQKIVWGDLLMKIIEVEV